MFLYIGALTSQHRSLTRMDCSSIRVHFIEVRIEEVVLSGFRKAVFSRDKVSNQLLLPILGLPNKLNRVCCWSRSRLPELDHGLALWSVWAHRRDAKDGRHSADPPKDVNQIRELFLRGEVADRKVVFTRHAKQGEGIGMELTSELNSARKSRVGRLELHTMIYTLTL